MYERSAQLLEAELGDELLALDAEAGRCFGFNPVAASVWRTLAQPTAFDDIRNALLEDYDVSREQCAEDLQELMQVLVAHGLVRNTDGVPGPA